MEVGRPRRSGSTDEHLRVSRRSESEAVFPRGKHKGLKATTPTGPLPSGPLVPLRTRPYTGRNRILNAESINVLREGARRKKKEKKTKRKLSGARLRQRFSSPCARFLSKDGGPGMRQHAGRPSVRRPLLVAMAIGWRKANRRVGRARQDGQKLGRHLSLLGRPLTV